MKILALALLLFQSPPSTEGWREVTKTHYEVKNVIKTRCEDVVATSFVGSFKIMKNPASENEFAFLVSKYTPITFMPPSTCDKESSRDEVIVAENYFQKTKQEKLKELDKSSDLILFIRWRENTDPRTREKILDGVIKNWLLKPDGKWIFKESQKPILKIELLSENGILVGFKFSTGEEYGLTGYHILMFDQALLGGVK